VDDELCTDHAWPRDGATFVGAHDRNRHARVRDYDPLAAADTADELAEEVPRVVSVVLRKAGFLGSFGQARLSSLT
jgi:hypothetical protein